MAGEAAYIYGTAIGRRDIYNDGDLDTDCTDKTMRRGTCGTELLNQTEAASLFSSKRAVPSPWRRRYTVAEAYAQA